MFTHLCGSGLYVRSNSVGMTEAQRMQRLARELMHSYARKVHVSIYAEGPTRILCFSEDKINAASSDDEDSLPNLEVRYACVHTHTHTMTHAHRQTYGGARLHTRCRQYCAALSVCCAICNC